MIKLLNILPPIFKLYHIQTVTMTTYLPDSFYNTPKWTSVDHIVIYWNSASPMVSGTLYYLDSL